jgi:hypothetical protein
MWHAWAYGVPTVATAVRRDCRRFPITIRVRRD